MIPSRYELYFDVSGSTSRCYARHQFVTVGGVALLPEATADLRKKLAGLPKWRSSNRRSAEEVALLIMGQAVVALTLRVYKEPDGWTRFWQEANEHYALRAQAGGASGVRYLKPESAIQRELYGECSARLVGETVERVGRPTIRDKDGLQMLQCRVVVDSEIQGLANQEAFFLGWRMLESEHPLLKEHGLTFSSSSVELATEQAEPLLLLPDHLAGAVQCIHSKGSVPAPTKFTGSDLQAINDIYERLPNYTCVLSRFDREYRDHLGEPAPGGP